MSRRVVVTGLGALSPLAIDYENSWRKLIGGQSAIKAIDNFESADLSCRIAAQIDQSIGFNAEDWVSKRDIKKAEKFIILAIAAAKQSFSDANLGDLTEAERLRCGVLIGSGIGGLEGIYKNSVTLLQKGPRYVSPFFIPSSLVNLAAGMVAMSLSVKGPNNAPATACSSSAHAIAEAARQIQQGYADTMVAGGSESVVCRISIAGFGALRALSTNFNSQPQKASRPWDKQRDGFVMGEGAGILILEEFQKAKKRGAHIYAEYKGCGQSADAFHITAPPKDGAGAFSAMKEALNDAELNADDIDYINAHATSTPLGDEAELSAIGRLFKDNPPPVSSNKSSIGHLLGAAGSVECIFSILAMRDGVIPPTINLEDPCDAANGFNLVPMTAQEKNVNTFISNSFGFGGTNVSLIFTAP